MKKKIRYTAALYILVISASCLAGCDFRTARVCYPAPGSGGLTYNGTYLWLANSSTVWRMTVEGHVSGFISLDGFTAGSLAHDGQYFWTGLGSVLLAFDMEGNEIARIQTSALSIGGLSCDGDFFWVTDSWTDTIYKIDADGAQLAAIRFPDYNLGSLVFDGTYLWVSAFGKLKSNHKHSLKLLKITVSGEVLRTVNIGDVYSDGNVYGLAYDGEHLWSSGHAPDSELGHPELCRYELP